jgi:dTDP-glucose 4,6-dehydratase/UDP-glucose 4-epimerase
MKILIIGSEGFIGSNAARYFKERDYEVFCADILIKEADNYIIINPELADFSKLFHDQTFDICLNASGAANVQLSFTNPLLDFTLNSANVFNILNALHQFNPKCKFINISSAAVYGDPQYLPIDENHPIKPLSPYGWHKYFSENICKEFYEYFRQPTVSIRVFSAYGPGLRKQIFWDLYQKSLKSKTIELFGTGAETRDFIYIEDLIFAIEKVIEKANFVGEIINVGNNEEITIRYAAESFLKCIGYEGNLTFNNCIKTGDPLHWKADNSHLVELGYQRKVDFITGLKYINQWIRSLK